MDTIRFAFFIIVQALLAGCAITPKTECSKEEIIAWSNENTKVIIQQVRYPPVAQRNKQEGKSIVSLYINADGTVKEGSIKQSTGWAVLDAEALRITKAKYSLPVCSGKNVPMLADIPINFSLAE